MLKDLVKQNRSYRSFDGSVEITRETLLDLVDCARFTPSSINMQPFKYYLSYKPETNDIIYPLTAWARLNKVKQEAPLPVSVAFLIKNIISTRARYMNRLLQNPKISHLNTLHLMHILTTIPIPAIWRQEPPVHNETSPF